MIRFASLGSGSEGNALIVHSGSTRLLVDCGFPLSEVVARLARLGLEPTAVDAILVTHEHADHAGGVARFARKFVIPAWLTYGTYSLIDRGLLPRHLIRIIDSHTPFAIGDLWVQPFPVPHDAREPVQYVFSDGGCKLGVLTDSGTSTPHIEACLDGVEALVLECNHDLELLWKGPYPLGLKQRVAGRFGHLDNGTSAALLARLDRSCLRHVIAAHLSKQNNHADLARAALASALGCSADWIGIAQQDCGFDWRQVG